MAAQYMPKTLAKTLTYVMYRSPGEYGLFWDAEGTMPWKELYWALQEDPTLRFVKESHLRELEFLGIELPGALEGNTLRLRQNYPVPQYPLVEDFPERLYYACRRRHLPFVREHGLTASSRPFLPVTSDKDLALRLARRREPEPVLIEILARKAHAEGMGFRKAGPELYLIESVPAAYLMCPPLRDEDLLKFGSKKRKEKPSRPESPATPGSYFVDLHQFQEQASGAGPADKAKKKGRRGAEWKRDARSDRRKREV